MGIVLGHVSGGISNPAVLNGFRLDIANWDISHIFVQLTNFLGPIGNNIFWICSCWFLIGDNRMSKRKLFGLILDVWLISVIILGFVYLDLDGNIEKEHIKRSFLPTLFENNWFITCYILMYAVHPLLNMAIERLTQRGLFRTALSFTLLYIILSAVTPGHFFPSMPTIWVAIYFIVAYIKLYLDEPSKNVRFNIICIAISLAAIIGSVVTLNYLESQKGIRLTNVFIWNSNQSPFVILLALSIFNIARNYRFENKAVNYLAGLTLFIYLIHENILLRTYYRPEIWNKIFDIDGYEYLALDCFIFSAIAFIVSVILSSVYFSLIKKPITGIVNELYDKLRPWYLKIESRALTPTKRTHKSDASEGRDNAD